MWMSMLTRFNFIHLFAVMSSAKIISEHSKFEEVLSSDTFVDKSMLIEELFNQPRPHFVLKNPNKFGKTTNLDMIKRFFEVQVYKNGSTINPKLTDNYMIFSKPYNKAEGFDFLNIFKRKKFVQDHFGQYPMIYLDFKGLVGDEGFHFTKRLIELIKQLFSNHKYLLQSELLSEKDKLAFEHNYKFLPNMSYLLDHPLWHQERLRNLAKLLVKHFGKKVILLVDNYDSPTQDIMFERKSRWHWVPEKIGEHLEEMIQVLVDYWDSESDLIEITLINASIPPVYAFGHFDSEIKHLSFTSKHVFNEFYSLQESELLILARRFGIPNSRLSEIKHWYGGYKVANNSQETFNIYSVLKFLESNQFSNYWVQKQNINIIKQTLKSKQYPLIREKFKTLCDGGNITIPNKITGNHIYQIRYIVNDISDFSMEPKSYLLFFNLLVDLGFCSVMHQINSVLTIKLVNEEVKNEFINILDEIKRENNPNIG